MHKIVICDAVPFYRSVMLFVSHWQQFFMIHTFYILHDYNSVEHNSAKPTWRLSVYVYQTEQSSK